MPTLLQDIRYAFRILHQNKGWTTVAIVSLALGIGANTVLFSAVDTVLIDTIPVPNPDDLIAFRWIGENNMAQGIAGYGYVTPDPTGNRTSASFPFAAFEAFDAASPGLEAVFAFTGTSLTLTDSLGDRVNGQFVSGNYYQGLGISAVRGRALVEEDDTTTAEPVVVISEGYWQRRFGGDPEVPGTTIVLNDVAFVIAGIIPAGLGDMKRVAPRTPDVSIPLAMESRLRQDRYVTRPRNWVLLIMGRTQPGASVEQLQADLQPVFARAIQDDYQRGAGAPRTDPKIPLLQIKDGSRGVYDAERDVVLRLTLLSVVCWIVLVIVCVSLANLLLLRSEGRQKEMVVRLSIGASPKRLIRQLLTESLVLAALGGGLGIVLAYACIPLLAVDGIDMDETVLGFATILTVIAGTMFGLVPALRASRIGLSLAMKETAAQVTRSASGLGKSLVIAQVALTFVLLIAAGLFLRTLGNLQRVPTGFNPENVLIFDIDSGIPVVQRFRDTAANASVKRLHEEILARLEATPGVRSVTVTTGVLLDGSRIGYGISIQGQDSTAPSSTPRLTVDRRFFETLGIPLMQGRGFNQQDYESGPPVAIANEAFARAFFPAGTPIGKRFGGRSDGTGEIEIVGLVGNVKYASLREEAPPMVYIGLRRNATGREDTFLLRTSGSPELLIPTIRNVVSSIDPNARLRNVRTQMSEIEQRYDQERLFANVSISFSGLALFVSMIGLFGLMSYTVERRTRELGIRIALGAEATTIRLSVLRESWLLVVTGIVVGVSAALATSRFIESVLFGLAPNDPATILAASGLMLAVATLASYLPARRASDVDPMVALRHE